MNCHVTAKYFHESYINFDMKNKHFLIVEGIETIFSKLIYLYVVNRLWFLL